MQIYSLADREVVPQTRPGRAFECSPEHDQNWGIVGVVSSVADLMEILPIFPSHVVLGQCPWHCGLAASLVNDGFPVSLLPAAFGGLAPVLCDDQYNIPTEYWKSTDFMEDIRRFVSLVNWHLWPRFLHSEQGEVSVASHCKYTVSFRIHMELTMAEQFVIQARRSEQVDVSILQRTKRRQLATFTLPLESKRPPI